MWLKHQKYIFSQIWRLQVQEQGVSRVGFSWGQSPCLANGHQLTVSSHGHFCPIRLGPHFTDLGHRTSFNVNHLFKGPTPKYSPIEGWGATYECWGGTWPCRDARHHPQQRWGNWLRLSTWVSHGPPLFLQKQLKSSFVSIRVMLVTEGHHGQIHHGQNIS